MTPLVVILCILLALILLAQIRVGGEVEYDEDGVTVRVRLGPLKLTAYPVKAKAEKKAKPKKEKKPKPEQEPAPPKEKIGGTLELLRELLPMFAEAAGKMKNTLRIDVLTLHLTWAATDPASAAMGFGAANAAMGMIYPLLTQNFNVKDSDIGVAVDFEQTKPLIYAKAALSLTIGQGTTFAFYYGIKFLSIWMKRRTASPRPDKKKEAVTHE